MPSVKVVIPSVVLLSCMLGLSALQAAEPAELVEEVVEVDLGTHSPGARFSTSIAAHNASCKGRHDFELVVRDAPWLVPVSNELTRIRKGRRKSTDLLVDTRGLEPGLHRGRIEVRCVTCPPPPKCNQDRTRVQVVLGIRGPIGDPPGTPGEPDQIDPENPANPLDSYGRLHNEMLDRIAADRESIETAGLGFPSRVAAYVAGQVCEGLEGAEEGCTDETFVQLAAISMSAEIPTSRVLDLGGFSPEQSLDVRQIEEAIALAFDETGPDPRAAVERIKRIEDRVVERAGLVPGGGPVPRCPEGWPPPCHVFCPLGPAGPCVPLPPVGTVAIDHGIDHAILGASSTARFSIAYWHREAQGDSVLWPMAAKEPGGEGDGEEDECKFWCKLWGVAKKDFQGALVGGLSGFTKGLFTGTPLQAAGVGAAVGAVTESAKAAF